MGFIFFRYSVEYGREWNIVFRYSVDHGREWDSFIGIL